jgi:outer membrane protein TolC
MRLTGFLLIMCLLQGCFTVGPDYTPTELNAPGAWRSDLPEGVSIDTSDPVALDNWWTTLNDPILTRLIQQAVQSNLDLKKARSRIAVAWAKRGMASADQFPSLGTSGSWSMTRTKSDTSDKITRRVNAGLDAGWEIDLFGRIQRSVEAYDADLDASRENLRDVLVSLLAEVALNYINVREYQTRLDIAAKNIVTQEET